VSDAVLIHIPHSSIHIPEDVRRGILLSDDELAKEIITIADLYTNELFTLDGAECVKNEYCRLVFDPERFRDDGDEAMARYGMGAIYVSTVDGRNMRELSPEDRERMMVRFYDPYHKSLEDAVEGILALKGKCLIIDGHSFPSYPLPFEKEQSAIRPDICIGTDDFHTPEALAARMEAFCADKGMSTRRNFPFAGAITPLRYYRRDARVLSVMIEVNRRLYIEEATGRKIPGFDGTLRFVQGLLRETVAWFRKTR
jgi:N-formylglutamate deformylase